MAAKNADGVTDITPAGGNIFEDLGFEYEEALTMKGKVMAAAALLKWIRANKLTQVKAAEILKVNQPEISKLKHNQFDGFTLEKLIEMLRRTGKYKVDVVIEEIA